MKCKYIITLLFFIGILFPATLNAQDVINETPGGNGVTKPEPFYRFGVEGGIQISYPERDGAFKTNFVGIYSFDGGLTVSVTKRFYTGIDLRFCQFATGVNPKYDTIKTQMICYMGGLKLGYHSSMAENFMFNGTLSLGEGYVMFNGVPADAPKTGYNQQSGYFNVSVMELYNAFEGAYIGFEISFTYLNYNFNPNSIGFQNYYNYNNSDVQGATRFISWGFEVHYCLGKKKK
jgi:hypothetical protein